jgi:predicted transcriptional regulator
MTKRRDRVSVASSILNVCSSGATKTKIVRQANLNFMSVSPYLENLKNKGLLEEIPKGSGVIYRTTPKGLEWRKRFEQSVTLLDEIPVTA